jgi:hypothetical protein
MVYPYHVNNKKETADCDLYVKMHMYMFSVEVWSIFTYIMTLLVHCQFNGIIILSSINDSILRCF